ncbi:alpha/beta fold hydrolase [Stutzerimonas stutzeri]|uniref:Alpha/beta hydrolase n=1 Tax=Stutzerimonas stutzeri TaxID=316 RepID=A0A6I6LQD9_STUST|nr:alpha/beta hydrolase [Stutzerimonas stutzeri]QGZ28872.1 alpha/beta hydrolase [Stutzerimonas stutzeri]
MSEPTRPVPWEIGPDGRTQARITLSRKENKVRAEIEVPPHQAIPVVFVPGIMGSPLLATGENAQVLGDDNRWSWFPDRTMWLIAPKNGYRKLSPAERKTLLNPLETRPLTNPADADREIVTEHSRALHAEEALNRGWGSVMLSAYGDLLNFLEMQLRYICTPQGGPYPGIQGAMPADITRWGEMQGYEALRPETLRAAAEFRYPVYAVGYNWLRSNRDAADYLAERIRTIIQRCESLGMPCRHGVILVTHSMGGLVARLCAKRYPALVQGIVHGVQPAIGAATAYRRVRAGWEDMIGAIGLGGTGRKIMPVFANAPGALELLPNQRYGAGWLRVVSDGKEVLSLPTEASGADPYSQIYLQKDAWWRLMDPEWIDPEPSDNPRPSITDAWGSYTNNIMLAKKFHLELGDYYHPNSYVHYGADESQQAFHRITWKLQMGSIPSHLSGWPGTPAPPLPHDHIQTLRLTDDNHQGRVWMLNEQIDQHGSVVTYDIMNGRCFAVLAGQDQAGDGTVPAHAAEDAARNAVFSARMSGYDHQGSYADRNVQNLTLYSILRIGATAQPPGIKPREQTS